MKINLVQGFKPNSGHDTKSHYKSRQELGNGIMGLCEENNRGYNISFSGGLQGKSVAAANSLSDKLFGSEAFGKLLEKAHKHNIITNALVALVLAGVLRPATILALPGDKDREDKIYAAGHALASGIIGFAVSMALTSPLDSAINKLYDNKKDFFGSKTLQELQAKIKEKEAIKATLDDAGKKELKELYNKKAALKTLVKNVPDWIISVPRAVLTIALIPPILKYVFGVEKKKKNVDAKVESTQVQQNNASQPKDTKSVNSIVADKAFGLGKIPAMADFGKGGIQ